MTKAEKFIIKAKEKFGDKFDYSKVEYINSNTPVIIVCPIHGEFQSKPVQFLQSKWGCKKCATIEAHNKQKMNNEQFITKAKQVWNTKYSYENTNYIDSNHKVTITCPIHGDFKTRPSDFLRKHGCPKCKNDIISKNNIKTKRWSQEYFLEKAHLMYGNLFSYENARYINQITKLVIHSNVLNEDFIVSPQNFFRGDFPVKYRGETINKSWNSYTTEEFVRIAKIIRPEYDYSKVEYKNNKNKIEVICPKHGSFYMTPINLIYNNQGCPICVQSRGETFVKNVLDNMKLQYKQQYKLDIQNKCLKIDFCLFVNNQIVFIEYNGIQHYKPIDFFGGKTSFEQQCSRDNLLRAYCKNNDIILFEYKYDIPFFELEEIIKQDLRQIINEK